VIIIETISFSDALKYPFKTPLRLLYILWGLIPILGSFIIFGYVTRLVNEFIDGRYEGLIKLNVIDDLILGIVMILKSIPFIIVFVIIYSVTTYISEALGIIIILFALFVIPILMVNFFRKQTIQSLFEFDILKVAKDNLGEYFMAILKQYALMFVFLILSIILIGIPAMYFTNYIFIANLYGNFIEQKQTLPLKTQSTDPLTV
jgi:hypothetical protein